MLLNATLQSIKGVGEKTENSFKKLGVYTVGDILLFFPRTYERLPEMTEQIPLKEEGNVPALQGDSVMAILGMLKTPAKTHSFRKYGKSNTITTATVFTNNAAFDIRYFNAPYMAKNIIVEMPYVFVGKAGFNNYGRLVLDQPKLYSLEEYKNVSKKLRPVYSLSKGIKNATVEKTVVSVLTQSGRLEDYLPECFIKNRDLLDFDTAIRIMHGPKDFEQLILARNRVVYDEFFRFFIHLNANKENKTLVKNPYKIEKRNYFNQALSKLPFELTQGQKETIDTVLDDLNGEYISERLLQGDVGSGKTIIAFLLMTAMAEQGYQVAIMAPTEVLATQHYHTFLEYFDRFKLPFSAVLLTGSNTAKEKKEIYKRMEEEDSLFIIGTHALIQEKAHYKNLAFAVTDEQHRFGVKQRKTLFDKGITPHILVMSATPIPRTLALILYGDMKISAITDVPARRLPIKNALVKKDKRETSYKFLEKEIQKGHQGYVICPLVDSSEKTEAENVIEYKERLEVYFNYKYKIGLLHGKMSSEEKAYVMDKFAAKELDILVSTTVIEVGINVPNATVMVIEDANRFGLSQLHQLRGRVGRGDAQSYCIFIDGTEGEKFSKRLEILSSSNDGFYIANEDLKLRGPGDFYGIRQSGEFNFRIADIYQDAGMMQAAAQDAESYANHPENFTEQEQAKVENYISLSSNGFYTNL